MLQFSNNLMIQKGQADVFSFLREMQNFPKWNYAVTEIKVIEKNDGGENYQLFRSQMGPRMEYVTVVEAVENEKITINISGGWFPYTMTYVITPDSTGKGTILNNKVSIKPAGLRGVLTNIFQGKLKNAVGQNLHVLKNMLENN